MSAPKAAKAAVPLSLLAAKAAVIFSLLAAKAAELPSVAAAKAAAAAPKVPSQERARMGPLFVTMAHGSIDFLQRKAPNRFWDLTLARWSAAAARPDMSRLRAIMECSRTKSYKKILSHYGAVRVDRLYRRLVEDNFAAWLDDDGTAYMDVGNDIYTRMFERTWPGAMMSLGLSNPETIGDCIEAILGFGWLHRRAKRPLPNIANQVIREIEKA